MISSRNKLAREGKAPKNFAKINYQRLKQKEEKVKKLKQISESTQNGMNGTFKLRRFSNVAPRIKSNRSSRHQDCVTQSSFAENKENNRVNIDTMKEYSSRRSDGKKCAVDMTSTDCKMKTEEGGMKNYIRENYRKAFDSNEYHKRVTRSKQEKKKEMKYLRTRHSLGELPQYLIQQKEEEAHIARLREEEEKNGVIPEGMCVLEESQRKEMVRRLIEKLEETRRERLKLPLIVETGKVKVKLQEIENRIREQEEAIQLFSKPRVLIYKDQPITS